MKDGHFTNSITHLYPAPHPRTVVCMFATTPYVPCAQSLETQQPHAQVDAPVKAPTTDAETYAMAEQEDGACDGGGEGERFK